MSHDFDNNLDFGDRNPLTTSLQSFKHPFIILSHVGFRAAAIFFYVFANVISGSFIIQFLLILSFLSADFWSVKNITGRFLVGLRWWNYVDAEGKNHWKFESSKNPELYDALEHRIFWGALVFSPAFWVLLVLIAFFTFQWQWMVVAGIGTMMSIANLYGYLKCKWNNSQDFTNYLTKWAFISMILRSQQQEKNKSNAFSTSNLVETI